MRVRELIEELQAMDHTATVVVVVDDMDVINGCAEVTTVEVGNAEDGSPNGEVWVY
jgi:hypothetical protein